MDDAMESTPLTTTDQQEKKGGSNLRLQLEDLAFGSVWFFFFDII
jgi:hypothetical protein